MASYFGGSALAAVFVIVSMAPKTSPKIAWLPAIPLLPVYQNSGQYWPNKQFIKKPGTIEVTIGEPIDLVERNTKEVIAQVQQWMQEQQSKPAH